MAGRVVLNERQMSLVRNLLKQEASVPARVLAQQLSCSERTVQYDVHTINLHFEALGLNSRVGGRRGVGMSFELASGEQVSIEKLVQGGTLSSYSDLERFAEGMLMLAFCETGSQTLGSLSRALFSNERQMRSEVRGWSQLLGFFGCSLCVDREVSLKGDEYLLRVGLMFLLCSFAPVSMLRDIEKRFSAGSFLANRTVAALERFQGFPFSENARHTSRFAVSLALSRLRAGRTLVIELEEEGVDTPLARLGRGIAKNVGIPVDGGEVEFLRRMTVCATRRFDTPFAEGWVDSSAEARDLAARLLEAMGMLVARSEFQEVDDMLVGLIDRALLRRRLLAPIPFRDPFAIKVSNMVWYATVMAAIWKLDEMRDLELFGGDIDRVAMLMLSVFERLRSHEKCRVAMVINCGVEQVKYACCRLERILPYVKIVKLLSDSSLVSERATLRDEVDIVVAFEHVEADVPVCQISYSVDEDDAQKVAAAIARWRKQAQYEDSVAMACPCKTLCLRVESSVSLAAVIRQSAVHEGVLDEAENLFEYAFNVSCVVCETLAVAVVPLPGVVCTVGRMYLTPPLFVGRKLGKFAVLYVAADDMPSLSSVIAQFKEHMGIPKTCAVSWGLPPRLDGGYAA